MFALDATARFPTLRICRIERGQMGAYEPICARNLPDSRDKGADCHREAHQGQKKHREIVILLGLSRVFGVGCHPLKRFGLSPIEITLFFCIHLSLGGRFLCGRPDGVVVYLFQHRWLFLIAAKGKQ